MVGRSGLPINTFVYSAPTKVILFGEHSVVYGHPAVSLAVKRRMVMRGAIHESPCPEVQLDYNGITWSFDPREPADTDSDPARAMYRAAFQEFPPDRTLALRFEFDVVSGGIGTSAALCVLVAAASRRVLNRPFEPKNLLTQAQQLEMFFHSNSSGVDVASVLVGAAIRFECHKEIRQIVIPTCPLLIVDSGGPRQTRVAVEHVRDLLSAEYDKYSAILNELGSIAAKFCETDDSRKASFVIDNFARTEALLEQLGPGCPEIDAVVGIAKANGLVAKLSGAGMGGIVLVAGDHLNEKQSLFDGFAHFIVDPDTEGLRVEEE
jgi:mevalonate kinase